MPDNKSHHHIARRSVVLSQVAVPGDSSSRWRLTVSFFSAVLFAAILSVGQAAAEPLVKGYGLDLEAHFDATSNDCPTCSSAQITQLSQGLQYLLSRFREETINPYGDICVAEAGLSRELAVLTYELVLGGQISEQRWREYLSTRAMISGGLSELTREEMLAAFVERMAGREGQEIPLHSATGRVLQIYGASQLSRLFEQMRIGEWSSEAWSGALNEPASGFGPLIDAFLNATHLGKGRLDTTLMEMRPQLAWIEGQLPHLAALPPDFATGDLPTRSEDLLTAYDQAVRDSQWAAFYFFDGTCAVEAQFAWRDHAMQLAENLTQELTNKSFILIPSYCMLFWCDETTTTAEGGQFGGGGASGSWTWTPGLLPAPGTGGPSEPGDRGPRDTTPELRPCSAEETQRVINAVEATEANDCGAGITENCRVGESLADEQENCRQRWMAPPEPPPYPWDDPPFWCNPTTWYPNEGGCPSPAMIFCRYGRWLGRGLGFEDGGEIALPFVFSWQCPDW